MKKNETLKWDFHRIYFWLFCLFLVIFLTYFSSTQFVQGVSRGCDSDLACGGDGLTCCGGKCVDVQTDENNCGDCKIVCATSETCCDGKCVDTKTDSNNCGWCGRPCTLGFECVSGNCKYIDPNVVCATAECGPVEYNGNTYNCGTCDSVVYITQKCNGNELVATSETLKCISGKCVSEVIDTLVTRCQNGCRDSKCVGEITLPCMVCDTNGRCIENPGLEGFECNPAYNFCEKNTAFYKCVNRDLPCLVCSNGVCVDNPELMYDECCNSNKNECSTEDTGSCSSEENGDAESSEENKNAQITKTGCLICERGVCTKNPRTDGEFMCEPAKNECSTPNSRCGLPCLVCVDNICTENKGIVGGDCNHLQNQCEEKGKACVSKEKDNEPKTLTIDIARFVRTTVSFAELGSMAGTWLDKTFGTSFFSTPLWGELEKTWPLGAKFFGGNWESSICRDLWCIIPDDTGISTVGSAIGSHIEGQKLKIGDELNLYKITFALNPATESLTGQMNFTIELYDNSGNKEYIDVNNDKKPDTWININNKYATSKTNPIAFYSEKDYQKICLRFFNTKDYIDELRLLLLSNSNQICSNFFEGDPSGAISEIQTGEIQVGGEVDECANC